MELIFKKGIAFEKAYMVIPGANTIRIECNEAQELFFEGGFYYDMLDAKTQAIKNNVLEQTHLDLLVHNGVSAFIDKIEGAYACIYIDKKAKKITVFSDKLKRKDIYYCDDQKEIAVSTGMNALRSKAKARNQMAVMSALYLHIPRKHTIFDNIFRLGYNESIELKKEGFALSSEEDKPMKIERYGEDKMQEFMMLIENAIVSRASDKLNVVQMSGGWDSSFMVAVLIKHLGPDKVKGITAELVLSDGTTYNTYEIEKVKKIAKFFGIGLDIVRAHLGDKKLLELWKGEIEEKIKDHELYHASLFAQFTMARHIKEKYGDDVVVFNGECCDSLNNLGFAQYVTIAHENKGFGEYSDKMLCYLYGPTFFKKVLDNSYENDVVFQIFKWYNKNLEFMDTSNMSRDDKVFEYLFSFMYAPKRLPFAQLENSEFIKAGKMAEFKQWIRTNYFEKIIKNVTPETLYYWFFIMYLDFHWQSASNIKKVTESLRNVRLPYLDRRLFEFFAKMPESWGRGLEINNAKYPLKRAIHDGVKNNTFKYPLEIIEASIIHAYNAHITSWPNDFATSSVISKYYLKNGKLEQSCKELISDEYFDKTRLAEYVSRFAKDPTKKTLSPFEWRLLTFLMIAE